MFKKRMLKKDQPYKRALISVDNSGADVVLGMLPLARELLRNGIEVYMLRI
jgi:type II pantothenate kinase